MMFGGAVALPSPPHSFYSSSQAQLGLTHTNKKPPLKLKSMPPFIPA